MSEQDEDLLGESVAEVTGKTRRTFMLRFRASGLLALYFFIQAFDMMVGHRWLSMSFDIIVGLCLLASYSGKPISIGPVEFGGW